MTTQINELESLENITPLIRQAVKFDWIKVDDATVIGFSGYQLGDMIARISGSVFDYNMTRHVGMDDPEEMISWLDMALFFAYMSYYYDEETDLITIYWLHEPYEVKNG